jgi:hypothetical protein
MLEYEFLRSLFEFLIVPKNNKKHWIDSYSWQMVEFMHQEMLRATKKEMVVTQYVILSYDKVFTFDN